MLLPADLLSSLEAVKGFSLAPFQAVHLSGEQITSIRLNPFKNIALNSNWATAAVPWCDHGRYLSLRPSFTLDPRFHAGAYYVQEASSMFLWYAISHLPGIEKNAKVLDLCAAPGGKSSLLAAYFTDGLLVANEVIKSRAAILVENLTKWGADQVVITNNDPTHFQSLPGFFDLILVDAPCSGSGLFRKDPAAIDEWSLDNVQLCSQRQQRILADILPSLKENGLLIYATCSYSPAEDEEIADWLIDDMQLQSVQMPISSEWGIVETQSSKHQAFGYRFYPNLVKGEGFFLSAFIKKGNTDTARFKEQTISLPNKTESAQIQSFCPLPEQFQLFKQGDAIRAIKKDWFPVLQQLASQLYIKKAGIEIGAIKGKDVIPSHELAMSRLPLQHFPSIELNETEALQFLRRSDLSLAATVGWQLVRFEGLPLGWIKALPNRINNYYPAEWRILKS
jgi:16S rRNA C967 or C1407 C5-methylase (RsmB/RsmF family)/NOL1/NOP2/fmu family ribosome biogenesis protein